MIVRYHIDQFETGRFDYRVSHEGEDLYADAGLASVEECISAAVDGLVVALKFGHRLELACNTHTPEMMKRLVEVKWDMINEWAKTKRAPKHAAWMHEKEFH
mgnify:CR=1 FL=1